MSYTMTKKTLEATPILYVSRRVRHDKDEIAKALGECFQAVFGFAMQKGFALAGRPLCRVREFSPGGMTLEAAMSVASPCEGDGEIRAGTLPAGPVVSTVHFGPYDQLSQAHAAIEEWLEKNGVSPAGDPWEVYLTDPGEVPDPSEWQTEVIRPIAP